MWYIHTTEYYSATKKSKTPMHTTAWVNLENLMLSERSHTQNPTWCDSISVQSAEQANAQRRKAHQWLPGAGAGKLEVGSDRWRVSGFLLEGLRGSEVSFW